MKTKEKRLFFKLFIALLSVIWFITGVSFAYKNVINVYADAETEIKSYCTATLDDEFTENEIIIVITHSLSISGKFYTVKDFSEIDCIFIEDLTENLFESGNTNEEKFNRILKLTISNSGKEKVLEAIKILEKRKDIISAEPNYIESFGYESQDESYYINNSQRAISIDKPLLGLTKKPNDPFYVDNSQWAIDKIGLPQAWLCNTGSSMVTVGVIDSGIDATNPDLKNRINVSLSKCFSDSYTNPLEDHSGHGTHVAGIIGAQGNNSEGIAGTCWDVSLVSLRVDYSEANTIYDNIIRAINYAGLCGINILNLSASYTKPVNYFKESIENYNGLFVCSAGNDGQDNDSRTCYPCNNRLSNLISVGNSNSNDAVGLKSNYGKTTVDIFAPGGSILSTIPVLQGSYGYKSGTSMAAPYVAGVAALILSENSNLTASQLKQAIMNNVDKVDALSDKCVSGGRLNAYNAVKNVHKHSYDTYTYVSGEYHRSICACGESTLSPHSGYAGSGRYVKCLGCGATIDTDKYPIFIIGELNAVSLTSERTTIISSTYQLKSYLSLNEADTIMTSEEIGEIIEYYDEKFFAEYSIMFGDIDIDEVNFWLLKNALNWAID